MVQASGFVSEISEGKYNLLSFDGEFILEGSLRVLDGFYNNLDLSAFRVSAVSTKSVLKTSVFSLKIAAGTGVLKSNNSTSDCSDPPGVCTDCACDCDCNDCACDCECDCSECWT